MRAALSPFGPAHTQRPLHLPFPNLNLNQTSSERPTRPPVIAVAIAQLRSPPPTDSLLRLRCGGPDALARLRMIAEPQRSYRPTAPVPSHFVQLRVDDVVGLRWTFSMRAYLSALAA